MQHLKHSETRAEATPRAWLPVGAEIAAFVNMLALREDIVAYVGPGAGGTAPAAFNPSLAEIEVNVDVACGEGTDPAWLKGIAEDAAIQEEWPVLVGAMTHESMHSRHSLWDIPSLHRDAPPAVAEIALALEESRIEARGVEHHPHLRAYLRACAVKLVIAEQPTEAAEATPYTFAHVALLTLARVDAGVLDASDVVAIRETLETVFGEELLGKMRGIWIRAQAVRTDASIEPLVELAKELLKLLEDAGMLPEGTSEGTGSGAGTPIELPEGLAEAMAEALAEAADVAEIEARGDIAEERERREWAEEAKQRASDASEQRSHEDTADMVFGKGTGPSSSRTHSTLHQERPPTGPERAAAVKVAQLLERARYQERIVTPTSSVLPPGRLRSRAAVQAAAERARGAMVTAQPWKGKHRRHVEDTTLTIGVMVDISGSMSSAMTPMGVTAWVFAEAARRIGARVAQVYYGNSVFAGLRPGEYQPDVRIYTAPDGTESFNEAFKALDGALNMLHGSGARLLVISSDMCYTHNQEAKAKEWIARLTAAGVAVLIMGYGEMYSSTPKEYERLGATVIDDRLSAADAALAVGRAAAAAIEAASARHNQ